jgi:hypothetical protein
MDRAPELALCWRSAAIFGTIFSLIRFIPATKSGIELIDQFGPIRILKQGLAQECCLRRSPEGRVWQLNGFIKRAMNRQEAPDALLITWQAQLSEEIAETM